MSATRREGFTVFDDAQLLANQASELELSYETLDDEGSSPCDPGIRIVFDAPGLSSGGAVDGEWTVEGRTEIGEIEIAID